MNPSQSESFWKSLLQDDIQRMRTPHSQQLANAQQPLPLPQSNLLLLSEMPIDQPNRSLQILQAMKSNKETPFQWNAQLECSLFKLHSQLGNRWSTIATRLGCPTDNSVKNKFYSTIRRGFRKLNKFITKIKRKRSAAHLSCNKLIKAEFLVKVTAVADKTHEQKYEVKSIALNLSQQIQKELIQLATNSTDYQENPNFPYDFEEQLLVKIKEFNRNCKKRKGKRKTPKNKRSSDESDYQNQQMALQKSEQEDCSSQVINKNNLEEKSFKNQEVQYPDALLMQEEKVEEKQQEPNMSIMLSQSNMTPTGFYTQPTPGYRNFLNRNKLFPEMSVYISKDSMSNKQLVEGNSLFIQNIPQFKSRLQALISSADLKKQEEVNLLGRTNSKGLDLFTSNDPSLYSSTKLSSSSNFHH